MTRTSFHTRMLIMSSLVVGTALALVISLGWSRILLLDVTVLDEHLCIEARRIVKRPEVVHEGDLAGDMVGKLQLGTTEQVMFRLDDVNSGATISPTWPDELHAERLPWQTAPFPSVDSNHQNDNCMLATYEYRDTTWHAALVEQDGKRGIIGADVAARSLSWRQELSQSLFIFVPLALALTAIGSWLLATLFVRPVNRLREAMRSMTGTSLDRRLPKGGEDREFQELIDAYNNMLARLETSFNQASRFSADAAHELKTPLTILQGHIEQAMHNTDQPATQRLLSGLLDEVGRLAIIARKLLLLSQADAGHLHLQTVRVDLTALLGEVLHEAPLLLAEQKLTSDVAPGLFMMADTQLLTQVFYNLLSNAVLHGLPQGWIRVSAARRGEQIDVVFANSCVEIKEAQRARFFDRFYRGEGASEQHPRGSGLGLSLAREIARAHGGTIELDESAAAIVQVRVTLPAAP